MSKKIKCLLLTSLLVMSVTKTEQVRFTSTKEAVIDGFEAGFFTGIIPIAFPFIFSVSFLAMDIHKHVSSPLGKTFFLGSAIGGAIAGIGTWSMVGQYITTTLFGTNQGRYAAAIPVTLALGTLGACYAGGYFTYIDRFLKINLEEYQALQEIVFKKQGKAFKTAFLNAHPTPTEEAVKKLAQCVDRKATIKNHFQPFTVEIGKKTVKVSGRIGLIFALQMDELA